MAVCDSSLVAIVAASGAAAAAVGGGHVPQVASCTADPTTVSPGETVTLDASSSNANFVEFDKEGDGSYERIDETDFIVEVSYAAPGTYDPVARADGDSAGIDNCGTVTVEENQPPSAALSVSPNPAVAGESVTFDASGSTDPDGRIVEYRWDFDSDGTVDEITGSATTTHVFGQADLYIPVLTVVDDDGASRRIERDLNVRETTPARELRCTVEPTSVTPGEEVTIDASESTGVTVVDYDVDGDGEYERPERTELVTAVVYEEPGTYSPQIRVHAGDRVVDCGTVTVEGNQPPQAAFTLNRSATSPGETIDIDASGSTDPDGRIVEYRWDLDGDGTIDLRTNSTFVRQTYTNAGSYVATLTVVDDDGATDTTSRDVVVGAEESGNPLDDVPLDDVPLDDIPGGPIGIGGGLVGLGGLLWYFFGGSPGGAGGGGGGGGREMPKPKPKPTPSDDTIRYETGVFALPTASGAVSVPVGFEPDLVLFSVVNGARTDAAVDRTAGGSFGIAHRTGDGLRNQCLTVADDARSTDQATCAAADDLAFQLVRHEADGPPGRVTGRVTGTSSTGFTLDATVPGDDPLAGGVRLLYQAFSTTSEIDLEVGYFETPTEPGTQTVDLGIDADHVSLVASAAVSDTDGLWTTDRGVGLTVGNAVADPGAEGPPSLDQRTLGANAWPGAEGATAAVCGADEALHLLYQDADQLAGRTTASVTDLGGTLRLQYDRVYNGPHKLGSTARHPVSYLAMAGGEEMRPAVGAFQFPRAGETATVDCGFEPAMVELLVTGAPIDEEVANGVAARPFDVSHGTAIDTGGGLRQYVLHHSVVAEPPAERADVPAVDETTVESGAGGAATDGGEPPRRSRPDPTAGTGQPGDSGTGAGRQPTGRTAAGTGQDVPPASVPDAEVPEAGVSSPGSAGAGTEAGESVTAPDPKETPDDGRAGLWLPQAPDGTVVGRDELRVQQLTATGFDVTAESVDTDARSGDEPRPAVVYRAWPTVDGERGSDSSGGGATET